MIFFGMNTVDDYPTINEFICNIVHKTEDIKKQFFDEKIGDFVDLYIFQRGQAPDVGEREDYVKNYALCVMFLTIVLLQLKDTAAEGDGDRNLINQKLLLSIFKSLGAYSKYAIEMCVSAQIECLLTERMSGQFTWGFFSNWAGGEGRNIEDDLSQEIFNNISKNAVKRMGGNKTVAAIDKICRATSGIRKIKENFDETANIHKTSSKHSERTSMIDELEMVKELNHIKSVSAYTW